MEGEWIHTSFAKSWLKEMKSRKNFEFDSFQMEIPTKFKLCPEEWLPDTGLVTAALKIRRKQIHDFYKSDIDRMYEGSKHV